MINFRVIPCLLLSNGGLVKTYKFRNPRYVGDPINVVRIFNEKEVDELILVDIDASMRKRPPDFELVEQLASECFMPIAYGGGIATLDQAKRLFDIGIEKITLQSALSFDPQLVGRIASLYGSQAVVASIDVRKDWFGRRKLYSKSGLKFPSKSWEEIIKLVVDLGAGEVLLNSVHRDGTRLGMDLELIQRASSLVDVPLTAIGGVGSLEDIRSARNAGASAVAAGTFFVLHGPHRAVLVSYPSADEFAKLWTEAQVPCTEYAKDA